MFLSITVLAGIGKFFVKASSLYYALIFYYYNSEMYFDVCVLILQVSGKYSPSNFIYQLIFVTSKGRLLIAGQPVQVISFIYFPVHSYLFLY